MLLFCVCVCVWKKSFMKLWLTDYIAAILREHNHGIIAHNLHNLDMTSHSIQTHCAISTLNQNCMVTHSFQSL